LFDPLSEQQLSLEAAMQPSRNILLRFGVFACALLLSSQLNAYDADDPQETQTTQCSRWLTAEVPHSVVPDPLAFCASLVPRTDGWNASDSCFSPGFSFKKESLDQYCASAGGTWQGMVLVAAYHAKSSNGQEVVDESRTKGADKSSLIGFYTKGAIQLGGLRLAPGFYLLHPAHTSAGWDLVVSKTTFDQHEEDLQGYVGNIQMKVAKVGQPEDRLRLFLGLPSDEPDSASRKDAHSQQVAFSLRLHLLWEGTDLSVGVAHDVSKVGDL
jgi:hypothetical protein